MQHEANNQRLQGQSVMGRYCRGWDFASSTAAKADYSSSVRLCLTNSGTYVIEDYWRGKLNPADLEAWIVKTASYDGSSVKQIFPVEPGSAGAHQQHYLSSRLSGFNFAFSRQTNSKLDRALPISSQVLSGNVCIVNRPAFYLDFVEELEAFSADAKSYMHDDFVDALSMAFNSLISAPVSFHDIEWENVKRFGAEVDDNGGEWRDLLILK